VAKAIGNSVIRALDEKTHSKTTVVQTAGELYGTLITQHRMLAT